MRQDDAHIVMVAPFGMAPKGTASARMLPLAKALVVIGFRVTLLVPPWDDPARSGHLTTDEGVRVEQLQLPRLRALDLPLLTGRLLQRAVQLQPDLLHTFKPKGYSGFVALAWWFWRRLGQQAPLIVDTDDWEGAGGWNDVGGYAWPQQRLFAWQERWGLRHHDGLTVASRTLEAIARERGVPAEKLLYLPNGPGAAWPPPPAAEVAALRTQLGLDDHPTALLFTRFAEFDVAAMAQRWASIVAAMPGARLLVVGRGFHDEARRFGAALAARGVADSVVMQGWQPRSALPLYFAASDVALYPMAESLLNRAKCPVKLADYLAAGLPVVGDGVGQVAEYLADNQGGIIVPPHDDAAFVAATTALLRDPDRAKALGQRGQARLHAEFAWPVQATRLARFYATRSTQNG